MSLAGLRRSPRQKAVPAHPGGLRYPDRPDQDGEGCGKWSGAAPVQRCARLAATERVHHVLGEVLPMAAWDYLVCQ